MDELVQANEEKPKLITPEQEESMHAWLQDVLGKKVSQVVV